MKKQKLKGLWIPVEVLLNKDLSDKGKINIYSIQQNYQILKIMENLIIMDIEEYIIEKQLKILQIEKKYQKEKIYY